MDLSTFGSRIPWSQAKGSVSPIVEEIGEVRVVPVPEPHFGYDVTKRAIDVIVAGSLLVLLSPLLMAVAGAIYLSDGFPVVFRQQRMGRMGFAFVCLKFRTMYRDAEARRASLMHLNMSGGPTFKIEKDPRIFGIGHFLRKSSIDELPQLWNVLKGEMSLVGPRPLPLIENQYTGEQQQRLAVKPGLTCTWQVSGRSSISFDQWMELDLAYIRERSLLRDLQLLAKTFFAVISQKGAH